MARAARPVTLVSWNVDHLARYVGASAVGPRLRDIFRSVGSPDIFCLQEIRVRRIDAELVADVEKAIPGHACALALSNDPKNVTFRGGRMYGVATYVSRKLGKVTHEEASWDREGRVLVSRLLEPRIAIVNVYAVNGTSKTYYDEHGRPSGDRHAYKQRFQARLLAHALELKKEGFELVLVGDWNVSRARIDVTPRLRTEEPHATARAHLNDVLIPSLDVVDIFRELHPDEKRYSWFHRRARGGRLDAARVDYALVSRSLAPRILAADIDERPEIRYASDHAPLGLAWTGASPTAAS